MKKLYFIIFLLAVFMIPNKVNAETNITGYVTNNDTLISSKSNVTVNGCLNKVNGSFNSNYAVPGKLHCLDSSEEVKILNYDSIISSTISSCSAGYYKVNYTNTSGTVYSGYMCADKVRTNIDTTKYQDEFKNFPKSYWEKLAILKEIHPNWVFTAYNTNLSWNDVLNAESVVGISYIQSTDPLYLSLDTGSYDAATKQYIEKETGGWYAANKKTVAYYMDPRNFLDEMNIFQFENLGYNSNYQTKNVVSSILAGTDLAQYTDSFIAAATFNGNNVSPVMLAARSKQEVVSGSKLTGSANGESGYYNFYNIGAWSSCASPISCAIDFAKGYDGEYTTYNRPWTTADSSIKNGANYIANGYINKGQNTLYFQKWDVINNGNNYNHQYMNNIMAAISEGSSTWKSYKNLNVLGNQIEFLIPVYNNMDESASILPTTVETVPETNETVTIIKDLLSNAGYTTNGNYITNIELHSTAKDVLNNLSKEGVKVAIRTTDSNGTTKEINSTEILGTGDLIVVDNGTNTGEYRIVVNGDVNGDGDITAVDYVKVKNKIMGTLNLVGSYNEAADVNKDGKISAIDYVKIKNHIMGLGTL